MAPTRHYGTTDIPLFLLLTTIAELSYGYTGAKLYWPLGNKSAALEVTGSSSGATYPNKTIYVATGHPDLSYKALSLDGVDDYISLTIPDGTEYKKLAFTFYVFPQSGTGTLLHFKSNSPQNDQFSEILIQTISDVILVTSHVNGLLFNTSAHSLARNQWNFIAVDSDFDTGMIEVYNATGVITGSTNLHGHFVLGNPGTLTLGKKQSGTDYLKGRFTCLALFDDTFSAAETSYVASSVCANPGDWTISGSFPGNINIIDVTTVSTLETSSTTTTTSSHTPHLPVAKKVWPLTEYSHGYELGGAAPLYPQPPECSRFTLGPEHSEIRGQAMLFDGYKRSFTQMELDVELMVHDFTLGFLVNPAQLSSGTILNYVYSQTPGIRWDIQLGVNGQDLQLQVISDSTVQCSQVNATGVLASRTWQYVAIERKEADGTFSLVVNNDTFQGLGACAAPAGLSGTGDLFVGNSAANDDSFRGSLVCLVLFDGELSDGQASLIETCNSTFTPTGVDFNVCNPSLPLRFGLYKVANRDASPSPQCGSPLFTSPSPSSLACCSLSCIEEQHCRSFSISRHSTCMLFDFVAGDQALVQNSGTNYYHLVL